MQFRRQPAYREAKLRNCGIDHRLSWSIGMGRGGEDRTGTARFHGERPRRQVSSGGGNGGNEPKRIYLSRSAAAGSAVQRGGCSGVLRFLLPGGGTAWRPADCDFNRRAESIAGAENSAATGTAGRSGRRGTGGKGRAET